MSKNSGSPLTARARPASGLNEGSETESCVFGTGPLTKCETRLVFPAPLWDKGLIVGCLRGFLMAASFLTGRWKIEVGFLLIVNIFLVTSPPVGNGRFVFESTWLGSSEPEN